MPYVSRTILEERRAASREDRPLLARVPVELFVLPLGVFAFLQLRIGSGAGGRIRRGRPLDPRGAHTAACSADPSSPSGSSCSSSARSTHGSAGPDISRATSRAGVSGDPRGRASPPPCCSCSRWASWSSSTSYRAIVPAQPRGRGARPGRRRLADQRDARPTTSCPRSTRMPPLTTAGRAHGTAARERHVQPAPDRSRRSTPSGMRRRGGGARTSPRRLCRRSCSGSRTPPFGMTLPAPTSTLTMEIDSSRGRPEPAGSRRPGWTRTASCTPLRSSRWSLGLARYELTPGRRRPPVLDHDPSDVARFPGRGDVRDPLDRGRRRGDLAGRDGSRSRGAGARDRSKPEGAGVRYEMESGASDVIGGIVPGSDPLPALVSPGIAVGGRPDASPRPSAARNWSSTPWSARCSSPR